MIDLATSELRTLPACVMDGAAETSGDTTMSSVRNRHTLALTIFVDCIFLPPWER
jgi:hypothetical protein